VRKNQKAFARTSIKSPRIAIIAYLQTAESLSSVSIRKFDISCFTIIKSG
jgi:ribosomal protein L30E